MNEQEIIININDIQICAESFGNPAHPAMLLMMGASASMIWWDEQFCRRLAENGRFVIRYDNRDVGRSTCYELGQPRYGIEEMVDDALGVLNFYQVNKAHLVGMSLGGMLAQLIALKYPERALTLTLIASSVWDDRPDLPPIDENILAYHTNGASLDWSDEQAAIRYMVGGWRLLNGSKYPFDEKRTCQLAETEIKRARSLTSMINHALLKGGESYYGKANQITLPTLVIHGTEDPVLPYQHGLALAETIPHARLLRLEGSGHEIHEQAWDFVIEAILRHAN